MVICPCATLFQSTRPRGARPPGPPTPPPDPQVSIHAPAWGATPHFPRSSTTIAAFQSTRPRGARPEADAHEFLPASVSIHAPAWGATPTPRSSTEAAMFQSTRPRGARRLSVSPAWMPFGFQSTRPRGARTSRLPCTSCPTRFQSTRPRGARLHHYIPIGFSPMFQSTRPRGARRWATRPTHTGVNSFNPRARVGRDFVGPLLLQRQRKVSIHAPAWGATTGDDPCVDGDCRFNPRARVGRDVQRSARRKLVFSFQSTRPRGARRPAMIRALMAIAVSIHAPAWGATTRASDVS